MFHFMVIVVAGLLALPLPLLCYNLVLMDIDVNIIIFLLHVPLRKLLLGHLLPAGKFSHIVHGVLFIGEVLMTKDVIDVRIDVKSISKILTLGIVGGIYLAARLFHTEIDGEVGHQL